MTTFVELERIDSRVIAALRAIDAVTATPIERPLTLQAEGVRLVRNASGFYVIREAPGFADYTAAFAAPPATPAVGSETLVLTASDAQGAYLPRVVSLALPRDPDPANADAADSLFRPADLTMFPSPAAAVGANWAVLRVSVASAGGDLLGGALLRVLRNGDVLARGLSDWRGEALVPVAGVPITTFSEDEDAVVISEIDVTVEALFDPASGSRTPAAGPAPANPPVVDPDALEAAAATLPRAAVTLAIAARRTQALALSITLP